MAWVLISTAGLWTTYSVFESVKFKPSANVGAVFDFVEFTLQVEKREAANPFTDASVSAEIAKLDGTSEKVDGFREIGLLERACTGQIVLVF